MPMKLVHLNTDLFGVATHEAGCPSCNYKLFTITVKSTPDSRQVILTCANKHCGKVVEIIGESN